MIEELKKMPIEEQIETILNKEKLEKLLLNCNFNELGDYLDDISKEIEKSEEIIDKCENLFNTLIKENEKIRNKMIEEEPNSVTYIFGLVNDSDDNLLKKELLKKSIELALIDSDENWRFYHIYENKITEKQFEEQSEFWTKEYIENIFHKSNEEKFNKIMGELNNHNISKKLYKKIETEIHNLIKEKINNKEFLEFVSNEYEYYFVKTIKKILEENPSLINKSNEEIISNLIKPHHYEIMPELLNHLSPETLKKIKERIKSSIENGSPSRIESFPENMLNDPENENLIKLAMEKGYEIRRNTPDKIKNNPKCIEYAIKNKQLHAIDYFPEELLNKPENEYLIDLAMEKGYEIRRNTPDKIKNNPKCIEYAINDGQLHAIDYFPEELLNKPENEYLMDLAMEHGYIIDDKSPQPIKTNPKYIEYAIEHDQPIAIFYFPEELLNKPENKYLIKLAIEHDQPKAIECFPEELLNKPENEHLMYLAMKKGYEIRRNTPDKIKNNPKYIEYAINDGQRYAIECFPEELLNKPENEHLMYLAMEHGYRITENSPQPIKTNPKYIEYAIEHDQPNAIECFPEELLNKPENEHLMYLAMEHGYIINDKSPQPIKTNPKYIEYAIYNKQLYDSNFFDKIDESKINQLADVCIKIFTTNSKSLFSIKKSLIQQLQTLEDPVDAYNKIEKIFIRNNIPLYAKMFFCFKILYPNLTNNFAFDDNSRMSPELKDSTLAHINIERIIKNPTNSDIRFFIIYNDLLRNAVKSNSKDLRKYLDNIEIGDYLYRKIIGENLSNENFDRLSEKDKLEALEIYVSHLETLYKNTKEGKQDNTDINNYDLIKKIKYLKEKFKITNKYDIKDRIIRSFGYSAGYTSFEQIRNEMNNAIKEAHERGIKLEEELENRPFEFDDGDFVRCIGDYKAFAGSIENGNFSKEFLTVFLGTNDSDTTPLDVDFSLITKKEDIFNSIEGTPTGFGFGNIFLIIKKDNPNINITRDKDGNLIETKYNPKKIEMFGTKIEGNGGYETHWGARTGISLTDVDYILYKEDRIIDKIEDGTVNYIGESSKHADLPIIKFEIAKHGYYIPIIDFAGKSLFSVDEYNKLRQQMNGMSYYDIDKYNFSDNLEIDESNQIIQLLETSNKNVEIKRNKIFSILSSTLEENNLKLKTKIDGDLTPGSVEVIDTGSTGRKTNKINDGDYDLLLRIDQNIYSEPRKYEELKKNIKETIEKYPYESLGITNKGDYRFKKVKLDENTIVDIDLSFTIKTDKISYSTDECLKDRLKTIEQQDKEKYNLVISNILIAKKVLKEAECYKPERSDKNQGGLGGAGIENWILQNGGSFIDAANNFLKTANTCATFNEFKKKYFVWDFGENHFAERKGEYPHDNFVDNMNEIGYEKMKKCLKEYLIEFNKQSTLEHNKAL